MIKIEIKDSVKIIENRNKIHYFVSGIEIFNFYFNFIELFLSLYPVFNERHKHANRFCIQSMNRVT